MTSITDVVVCGLKIDSPETVRRTVDISNADVFFHVSTRSQDVPLEIGEIVIDVGYVTVTLGPSFEAILPIFFGGKKT